MGFTAAWSQGYTGTGVVIADIDTGFDFHNSRLTEGINFSAYNWNFINHSNNVQDDNGHGTMTASEMVADPGTGFGVVGAAFDAQLMVLKALDSNGQGSTSQVCEAIYYAVDHGADVINLSLGQNSPNTELQSALAYANTHDVVVVAAAGNNAANTPCFPAVYAALFPNVIAVGATQYAGTGTELAYYSNHAGGTQGYNYVSAIGTDLIGYGINNTLWSWTGTSMASPLVAAQAAIIESTHSGMSASQVIQTINATSVNLHDWLNTGASLDGTVSHQSNAYSMADEVALSTYAYTHTSYADAIEHVY